MSNLGGYRGYIATRAVRGIEQPHHIQNLVVRDYAQRNGLVYKLSAVEYAMPGSYLVLESVLDELPRLDGIICYSLFMLPENGERRAEVVDRVLAAGCGLHGALENLAVCDRAAAARLEDLMLVDRFAARHNPMGLSA